MVSEVLRTVLINIAIYTTIMALAFFLLNFLTKGFVSVYLKVKGSRGKKVLVRVLGINGYYYRVGWFKHDQKFLHYKSRTKDSTGNAVNQFIVEREDLVNELGVSCVTYDETRNLVMTPNGEIVEGHKTGHIDDIIVRAIQFAKREDKLLILIIILIILVLFVAGYGAYTSHMVMKRLPHIESLINSTRFGVI